MGIKTVIFDFDGTIADTLPVILTLINQHAQEYGFNKLAKAEAEKLRNFSARDLIKKFGISLFKLPFMINKIKSELGQKIDSVKLFPGVDRLIRQLRQKKIGTGIITSNSKENVEKFLSKNKLNVFEYIYSEQNIFGKEKVLKNLLKKANLEKSETIYVGDEVRDIDACRAAGIKIICVTWGFNKKEILQKNNPDFLIENPHDLLNIIKKN